MPWAGTTDPVSQRYQNTQSVSVLSRQEHHVSSHHVQSLLRCHREVQFLALSCISCLLQPPCTLLKKKIKKRCIVVWETSAVSQCWEGASQALGQCLEGFCHLSAPWTLSGLCWPCSPTCFALTLALYLCSSCCYKHTPSVFQLCLCFLISFSCSSCCRSVCPPQPTLTNDSSSIHAWSTSTRFLILTGGN